jgi:hypothetical protein
VVQDSLELNHIVQDSYLFKMSPSPTNIKIVIRHLKIQ